MILNQEATFPQKDLRQSKVGSFALALQGLAAITIMLVGGGCSDLSVDPPITGADKKPIALPPLNLLQSKEAINAATERGRIHFDTYACWRCHTLGAEELAGTPDFDNSGPDLEFVGDRLDPRALHQSLISPNQSIAEPRDDHVNEQGYSRMPPFDSVIPDLELIDLVTFLTHKKRSEIKKGQPVIVTEGNFDIEVASADQLVLLDFWAEWCVPCLEIEPLLETIAADLGDQIKICKINVDDNPNLVADHVPDNMFPCLILMTNNTLIERVYGTDPKMEPKAFLDQWIARHLAAD
ncbi:MAG: c-type cytochrome [Verrucomicrobia bacterium]|nr:c-type cytochrome [Verrucomicrobiota bacterium]